ncbi:hypothetical protein ADUPG1_000632 [Aduncisulcus paluster]|uniref:Uncharacterized protein n=1 Tax=Aduncisulcus paluster TaxID=2918883 RepID=A0ABQ5KBZ5_9EUKA|nr:hypothetical protein ADUPG1_000632 [Aduncisulcus paluster]
MVRLQSGIRAKCGGEEINIVGYLSMVTADSPERWRILNFPHSGDTCPICQARGEYFPTILNILRRHNYTRRKHVAGWRAHDFARFLTHLHLILLPIIDLDCARTPRKETRGKSHGGHFTKEEDMVRLQSGIRAKCGGEEINIDIPVDHMHSEEKRQGERVTEVIKLCMADLEYSKPMAMNYVNQACSLIALDTGSFKTFEHVAGWRAHDFARFLTHLHLILLPIIDLDCARTPRYEQAKKDLQIVAQASALMSFIGLHNKGTDENDTSFCEVEE